MLSYENLEFEKIKKVQKFKNRKEYKNNDWFMKM